MRGCTYRLSLDELLNRPIGTLVLRGRDGEPVEPDGAEEPKDGDKPTGGTGDKDDADKPDKKVAPSAEEKRIAGLEEERDRHFTKRKEAETALAEAKRTIAQLQKDGSPDDALKKSNDDLTASNTALTSANESLMLENAFLKATGYDWVDSEAALRLADLSNVEFDEKSHKATGLESALAKLAKDKPYLLKPKADADDTTPPKPGTGTPPAPSARSAKDAADRAAQDARLKAKYPALRRG